MRAGLWLLLAVQLVGVPLGAESLRVDLPALVAGETPVATVAGRPVEVRDVEAGPIPVRTVVYLDRRLTPSLQIRNGLRVLAAAADGLVAHGPVGVVTAEESVVTAIADSSDARGLREALEFMSHRQAGDGGQVAIRERFLEEARLEEAADSEHFLVSATAGSRIAEIGELAREAVAEERELLGSQLRQLVAWAADAGAGAGFERNVLIWLGGDLDPDPAGFYRRLLEAVDLDEAVDTTARGPLEVTIEDVSRALSTLGWTVVAFRPEGERELPEAGEEEEGGARVETVFEGGRRVDRTIFTPDFDVLKALKKRLGKKGERLPEAALADAAGAAGELVRPSAGLVVDSQAALTEAVATVAGRARGTVELDGKTAVEVWSRPLRLQVHDAESGPFERWLSLGSPPLVAELRARSLLDGDLGDGGLLVEATLAPASAIPGTAAEPEQVGGLEVAVAAEAGATEPRVLERLNATAVAVFEDRVVAERIAVALPGALSGTFELPLPAGLTGVDPDMPLLVIVEDPATGRWGGNFASLVSDAAGDGAFGGFLPAPRAIHLLAPREPLAVGRTRVDTVLSPDVARVEFFLDGELEETRSSPPYSVSVVLGRYPERRRVEAVAFDAAGGELGRDRLILNAGTGTFRVRIVSPSEAGRPGAPLTGAVEVRASIEMPRGAEMERAEFFWNESRFATRFAPPYAQRYVLPQDGPSGFFRVVATLRDGSQTEDVLFVNSPGGSERVRVELIELYTVVTDGRGRPVTGLAADRFRVFEDGVEQEVATFSEAGDLPLTVGLAVDSSASMFVKLPDVQRAAAGFVQALSAPQDRAFVVRFGGGPELVHDTSRDLSGVERSLGRLEPEGKTEIWKGIVYSLVQLQGVPGKKALIVYSDGADEDPDFSYKTCLRFARRVGVPVYVIVSNDEIFRTQGKGLTNRGFMNRLEGLVRSVGGRVFLTRVGEDLDGIYADINRELRSQYLLGYYVRESGDDRWRDVRVEVRGGRHRARTLAGYYR